MFSIPTAANTNTRAAKAGDSFYPEMGERHDGTALFIAQVGYGGYYCSWSVARHTEALAAFKSLRIRPSSMSCTETTKGGSKWSACLTYAAGRKIMNSKCAVFEALLD